MMDIMKRPKCWMPNMVSVVADNKNFST